MPHYTVSRKIPSMDSYTVTDESGAQVYGAKHHLGLMHESWDITDAQGQSVATLTHDRKHLHATYQITGQGLPDLHLTKVNYMPVAETWSITGGGSELTINGDLANYNWTIQEPGGPLLATLQRKIVSLHAKYLVDVQGDPRVPLAMAIALDAEQDERKA